MKVLFILCVLIFINAQTLDDKGLNELLLELGESNHMAATEFVYFFRIREEKRKENVHYFIGVFRKFLPSIGVRGDVYNWDNHDIVVITKHNIEIDIVLEHMSDWIDRAGSRSTAEFKKKEEI